MSLAKTFDMGLLAPNDRSKMRERNQKYPKPKNVLSLRTPKLNKERHDLDQKTRFGEARSSELFKTK